MYLVSHFGETRKYGVSRVTAAVFLCTSIAMVQAPTAVAASPVQEADVITGATPNAVGIPGVNKSTCWKEPDCTSCHGDVHLAGFQSPTCPFCHGDIGAPERPPKLPGGADHRDTSCTQCHPSVHAGLQFEAPRDCRSCHGYRPEGKKCTRTENYDAVVVGGGGGGLAAASVLATHGLNVVLLERLFETGGYMHNFERYDYRFEVSLHTMPGIVMQTFNILGIANQIVPLSKPVMYRAVYPDFGLNVPTNVLEYEQMLKTQFPQYESNISALFQGFNSMDFATYGGMTLLEALSYHGLDDERFVAVFSIFISFLVQGGVDDVPAQKFLLMWWAFHHLGYYYFEGGSQAVIEALEASIVNASGTVKRNAEVSRIFVENNQAVGVQTTDGVCYNADYVVSNANGRATFLNLVGSENLPEALVDEVNARHPADSPIATLYLGVDQDYRSYFQDTYTLFVMTNYDMLTEEWENLACLPEQATLLIENYTAIDPTTAPPGKNVITVTPHLMQYECNDYWKWNQSYESYTEYKNDLAEILIARLEAILPGISDHIEVMEMATPHTFENFTQNPNGTWAGWAFEPDAEFEYTERIETPISGLYMVGAWAAGPGQSVVLKSGIDAANLILDQY